MLTLLLPFLCTGAFILAFTSARRKYHTAWTLPDKWTIAWGIGYIPAFFATLIAGMYVADFGGPILGSVGAAIAWCLVPGYATAMVLRQATGSRPLARGIIIDSAIAAGITFLPLGGFQLFIAAAFWNLGAFVVLNNRPWPNASPDSYAARRLRGEICLSCGYDLIGNTSGTCSECGVQIHPVKI